jgi:hypothetical protein
MTFSSERLGLVAGEGVTRTQHPGNRLATPAETGLHTRRLLKRSEKGEAKGTDARDCVCSVVSVASECASSSVQRPVAATQPEAMA